MTIGEKIQKARKEREYTQKQLAEKCGVATGTIQQYELGKRQPRIEQLEKIANVLEVPVDYLISDREPLSPFQTCTDCGFFYDCTNINEIKEHKNYHTAYEKAVARFGKLYCNKTENEEIKHQSRTKRNNLNIPLKERYDAELNVLRCLFSRSIEASNFDLSHVDFNQYVAMMLNNEKYRKQLDNELCKKLIDNYGTMKGIKNGESYYHVFSPDEKVPKAFILKNGEKTEVNKTVKFTTSSRSHAQTEAYNLFHSLLSEEWVMSQEQETIAVQLKDILGAYNSLNDAGRKEAVNRIDELTEIPRYTKPDDPPQS